jgi:hypothetical protein
MCGQPCNVIGDGSLDPRGLGVRMLMLAGRSPDFKGGLASINAASRELGIDKDEAASETGLDTIQAIVKALEKSGIELLNTRFR